MSNTFYFEVWYRILEPHYEEVTSLNDYMAEDRWQAIADTQRAAANQNLNISVIRVDKIYR